MQVKELGHVVLYVRDLERSRTFYRDVLGFPEVVATPPIAAFSTPRTHHELLLIEVGEEAAALPPGRRVGMYHFGLKIGDSDDDLRQAVDDLRQAGVAITGATDHTVSHSLYIADPDGNEIELYIDVQPAIWRDNPEAIVARPKPLSL